MLDAGDVFFEERELSEVRREQEELEAHAIARAYKKLGVEITVPGPRDFALGVAKYRELLGEAGLKAHAANLEVGGEALPGEIVLELEGIKAGVIAAVEPSRYEGIEGVRAAPAAPAVAQALARLEAQQVEVVVLLFQGDLRATKELVEAHPRVDFAVIGDSPRETDQVDMVGRSRTLEVFDQGRYVGVLKLYDPEGGELDEPFENARVGSKAELEKVDRQIAHVNGSIDKLPPAAPGEEPPLLRSLRDRLAKLEARKREIEQGSIELPEQGRAFIWRPVRLDEGYPADAEAEQILAELNQAVAKLNAGKTFELVPARPGEPFYVGNTQCKTCHAEAYAFWEKTNHASAYETLAERNKDYDQGCIGCHVVGYEKPGGSVIGKFEYDVELGETGYTVHKQLRDVGCENCHGPGSKHVEAAMFGKLGDPKAHIVNDIDATTCTGSCHVPEHSPRFNWATYVETITGPGHARRGE